MQTGLRVSELIDVHCGDVVLGTGAHVRCRGKGRKDRSTPLRADTVAVLGAWLDERADAADRPLFVSNRNGRLSRDAVERIVQKYVALASERCPTLKSKHVSPHCLRHTAAMELLHKGVGCTVIALWLGHESVETTQIYLHADLQVKEKGDGKNQAGRYATRSIRHPVDTGHPTRCWTISKGFDYGDYIPCKHGMASHMYRREDRPMSNLSAPIPAQRRSRIRFSRICAVAARPGLPAV